MEGAFSARAMEILPSSIYVRPFSTASGVTPPSTSRPSSDFPIKAPRAIAIGRPIIPVPGIPTPIAFLSTLALRRTSTDSGTLPKASFARATHKATATGSVQPTAGTTSRFTSAVISSLNCLFIMVVCLSSYKPLISLVSSLLSVQHFRQRAI